MKLKFGILFIVILAASLFLTSEPASAVSGSCYFSSAEGPVNNGGGTCSVERYGYYGINDVLSGRSKNGNGSAIPSSVNTKSEFIRFVLGRFGTNRSDQDRVGSAFLMQEMRGSRSWPDSSDVQDWVNRMNNPDVTVNRTKEKVGDTSYFDSKRDNVFYGNHYTVTRYVLNIYYKGKQVSEIEYPCGNLIAGNPNTLPEADSEWSLDPNVDGDDGIFEAGSEVGDVTASIDVDGRMDSGEADWWFGIAEVPPSATIPEGDDDSRDPQSYFSSQGTPFANITKIDDGDERFTSDQVVARDRSPRLNDLPTGTKVCWLLSVKPGSSDYGGWRHADPVCVTIGKKPKLQVLGGDVWVGGKISTSTSVIDDDDDIETFGSWVEFGGLSVGENIGFASGAGLRGGDSSSTQDDWSGLTFANTKPENSGSDGQFGYYSNVLPTSPNLRDYFEQRTKGTLSSGSISNEKGVIGAGSISISTSENISNTIVIVSSGTVRITGNITLAGGGFNSINDIPQVVIIAKNISISPGVNNIDAWLIADGWINTCSTVDVPDVSSSGQDSSSDPASGKLTATTCNERLRITGPVASKRLYLYRTAGSDGIRDIGKPAETFNLRPDAYLWAYNYGLNFIQPTTLSISELPPRY